MPKEIDHLAALIKEAEELTERAGRLPTRYAESIRMADRLYDLHYIIKTQRLKIVTLQHTLVAERRARKYAVQRLNWYTRKKSNTTKLLP